LPYNRRMEWKPSRLTRAQMEERRLAGGRLLRRAKWSQAEVARFLGVSRATVSAWAKQLAQGGLRRLRRRKPSGRPPKLTKAQRKALLRVLKRDAQQTGFPTERWTLQRIAKVIGREFHVVYHPHYVAALLEQWHWSLQVPLPRAKERDDAMIRAWLAHDWPRIKKSAAERRNHRVFR
jgi:transposase